ncbi:MAG: glycoside hydrolase family 19 protein [Eikenella sp.]|nr:glycoside hydrolase family 19 protein [Eikenella sp.]
MIVNAAEKLKQGDVVSGLTGLKDCASGRCLNVRLDGKGVAPPGWQSVCEPPKRNGYYVAYQVSVSYWPFGHEFVKSASGTTKTVEEAISIIKGTIGFEYDKNGDSFPNNSDETAGLGQELSFGKELSDLIAANSKSGFVYGSRTKSWRSMEKMDVLRTRYGSDAGGFKFTVKVASIYIHKSSCRDRDKDICKEDWPIRTCSEILYHRQTGIFKPACAKHDPHLPEHLKRDRECLSLCDQDGNRVFIRHATKGLEIWQDKYRQGALVDPATLKVKAVGREKPTVSELALRLHNAALQAVNQIRVGQEINLSANQAVNVRAGSGIRIASQTEKGAVLLGERIGRTALKVVGICEEKEIAFDVQPSLKDEFVEHLWRAMEKYGIRQENDVAAFLGNVDHESLGGKQLSEATKYSFRGWQNLAPNVPNIRRWLARHGRNAEAEFAKLSAEDKFNIMYAGKNGNTQANDGWTFRGRGGIQLTGRAIYQAFADYSKRQDIMSNPDIVANDPQLAAESSAWFWKIYKPQASERAIRGDFPGARKAVNGSLKGWDDVNAKTSGYLNRKGALMPK